jgi:hypothetical protein
MEQKLRNSLLHNATLVDRIESLPSPYLWNTIVELENQCSTLRDSVQTLMQDLDCIQSNRHPDKLGTTPNLEEDVRVAVQAQTDALIRIASRLSSIHDQVDRLKTMYREKLSTLSRISINSNPSRTLFDATNTMNPSKQSFGIGIGDGYNVYSSKGPSTIGMNSTMDYRSFQKGGGTRIMEDPFLVADLQEMEEDRKLQEEIQRMVQITSSSTLPTTNNNIPTTTTSSSTSILGGGLMGSQTVPTTSNPFLFPSTHNPTASSGGLFGTSSSTTTATATPASTTLASSLSTPTFGFQSTPTTAPAPTTPQTPSQTNVTSSLFSPTPSLGGGGLFGSNATSSQSSSTTTTAPLSSFPPTMSFPGLGGDTTSTSTGGLFGSSTQGSLAVRRKSTSMGSSSSLNRKKR